MASLKSLSDQEKAFHKLKVKDLKTAIIYLTDQVGFLHNQELYRKRNGVSHKSGLVTEGTTSFLFESESQTQLKLKQGKDLLKRFQELFDAFGNISGFNIGDLSWGALLANPAYVLKKGGSYNDRGYPVYAEFFYKAHGKWYRETPASDAKGFYFFGLGQEKVYFYNFPSDSDEEEPQPGPSTKQKKQKKHKVTKPKPKARPPQSSKHLLGRKGHGLSRLLAEAADPPIVEFRGPLEQIKGFRRRVLQKYTGLFSGTSSSYIWSHKKEHRFLIEFESVEQRSKFLEECTLKLPSHRLGNFDTQ